MITNFVHLMTFLRIHYYIVLHIWITGVTKWFLEALISNGLIYCVQKFITTRATRMSEFISKVNYAFQHSKGMYFLYDTTF